MRKKHMIAAGAIAVAGLIIPSVTCTPVLAETGITKEALKAEKEGTVKNAISNVSLGNWDLAFATFSAVAKKTSSNYDVTGRNVYAVTKDFPLEFRVYFNRYEEGTSGDEHAVGVGTNIFRIFPSGVGPNDITDYSVSDPNDVYYGTTDVNEWPFPEMETCVGDRDALEGLLFGSIKPKSNNGDADYMVREGIGQGSLNGRPWSDSYKGILSWEEDFEFSNPFDEEFFDDYKLHEAGSEKAYFDDALRLNDIVGRPGDRLEVMIYQSSSYFAQHSSYAIYPYPTPWLRDTFGTLGSATLPDGTAIYGGNYVHSGYIYIPYDLTYDINEASGTTPTKPTNVYLTCDHNTIDTPLQADYNLVRGDAKLLGWSTEERPNVITQKSEVPSDMVKPGETYTISKDKRTDIVLHAVWADKNLNIDDDVVVPLVKRVVQVGDETIPELTFEFAFEQKSEWEGVSYVSTAAPIGTNGKKSVTVSSSSDTLTSDPYVGDLTGKTLYEGKIENIFSGYSAPAAGKYCYLVSEVEPNPKDPNVTYTSAQYVLTFEADAGGNVKEGTPKITLYKDSEGKTAADYEAESQPVPAAFGEKQELIYYNTYKKDGGTTPTGVVTNATPFIVIGGAGIGALVTYATVKGRRRKKDF